MTPESSLQRLLPLLLAFSPLKLLFFWWALLLFLNLLSLIPYFEGIALAAGVCLFCCFAYLVVLGLPDGIVRESIRSVTRGLLWGLIAIMVLMSIAIPFLPSGYSTPTNPESFRHWIEFAVGLVSVVVVFAPFFLAAAALNDVLRHLGTNPTLMSLSNFLAVYCCPVGGLLVIHPKLRLAFERPSDSHSASDAI